MPRSRFARFLLAIVLLTLSLALYAAHRFQEIKSEPAALDLHSQLEKRTEPELYPRALARLDERLAHYPDDYEASLLKSLILFRSSYLLEAQKELAQLTLRAPHFHLAHLVQGDLLLAQTQTVTDIGTTPLLAALQPEQETLRQLRAEAEVRLKGYLDALPQDRLPRVLLALGEEVQTAIVVDKEYHRLYIYERQGGDKPPKLLRDYYISTGRANGNKLLRGDLRTPEGVYFITSHIPSSALPDKYGSGAFPLNYPNELDKRMGKTGDGIWLHGTENAFYSRPPLDSEGCVVLPNIDLEQAAAYIRPGVTPLVITSHVEWVDEADWWSERRQARAAIDAWLKDWASGDVERYLAHYANNFWSPGFDLKKWQARKRNVAKGKTYQEIDLSNLSLFFYPQSASNGSEIVVASFRQHYRSNNFKSEMNKRLYLVSEAGRWQVLYEGGH
ncbi:MAG: L,D-transpeptidase family protein [Thiohalomonadaceae bacterium]